MTRTDKVFNSLAGSVFLDVANKAADRIGIDGTAVAVAVNAFPEDEDDNPAPYIATTIYGNDCGLSKDREEQLFKRIGGIMEEVTQWGNIEPFCVTKHPGLALTVESDYCNYAYMIIVIDLPPEAKAEIDEVKLIAEIVEMINQEMPVFTDEDLDEDPLLDDIQAEDESDPSVSRVYGILTDPEIIHSYFVEDIDDEE